MKFALAQLGNFKMPYSYDEELDLSEELNGFEDIISSDKCFVHTMIKDRGENTWLCVFNVKIKLILQDSVSLEEIPYDIDVKSEEIFTKDESMEDATIIEGLTLDTKEAIISTILENKPVSQSSHEFDDESDYEEEEEEEKINPAFASLKDLL